MVGTGEVTASLTAAPRSGVLIDVDGEVEEEWSSCSKCPLLGASVTQGWVLGGLFLIPLPSSEGKGYDSFCLGFLPQASVYPSHTPSSR